MARTGMPMAPTLPAAGGAIPAQMVSRPVDGHHRGLRAPPGGCGCHRACWAPSRQTLRSGAGRPTVLEDQAVEPEPFDEHTLSRRPGQLEMPLAIELLAND